MKDRLRLGLLGLLAAAAGAYALVLGETDGDRTLYDNPVSRYVGDNGVWLWPVAAAVLALVALLVLRGLLRGLRSDTVRETVFERSGRTGRTVLDASALVDAVVAEVEGFRGVLAAKGRLVGDPDLPRILLRVTIGPRADVGEVQRRIEGEAVTHARAALDDQEMPVELVLVVAAEEPASFS